MGPFFVGGRRVLRLTNGDYKRLFISGDTILVSSGDEVPNLFTVVRGSYLSFIAELGLFHIGK